MGERGDNTDIRCTMALLKAMHRAGKIPTPLAVAMCPPGHEDVGWERAAKEYLDHVLLQGRALRPRKSPVDWAEENERMDWEEKRESIH